MPLSDDTLLPPPAARTPQVKFDAGLEAFDVPRPPPLSRLTPLSRIRPATRTRYVSSARVSLVGALGRRLVAAMVLIGCTRAAHTELARLGLALPDSLLTRPEGSPLP